MRKLGLALILSLLGFAPAQAQGNIGPPNAILCNTAAQLATGSNSITQILALAAGKIIAICGWSITNTAASGTFQLSFGTGSNCGTGNTVLTPIMSVGATAVTDHANLAVLSTPVSQALCINPSVTTISGIVWVAQF